MVSIRKVEAVLAALNDSDDAGIHTRLKYLNLNKFPPGLRVGKAKRADYGLEELLAYALWFSLSRACFPPATATALVIDLWPEWVRLFLAAAAADLPEIRLDRPSRGETMAIVTGSALAPYDKGGASDDVAPARSWDLANVKSGALAERLTGAAATSVVIDVAALRREMIIAFESGELATPWGWAIEQTAIIASDEGWSDRADWRDAPRFAAIRPKAEVPARGERLGERDYYYARAIELLDAVISGARRWPGAREARLRNYLLRPSPREAWKRWVEVDGSGVPFVWAMEALVGPLAPDGSGIPETMRVSAAGRIADGDIETLAGKLRSTAERARVYEPADG